MIQGYPRHFGLDTNFYVESRSPRNTYMEKKRAISFNNKLLSVHAYHCGWKPNVFVERLLLLSEATLLHTLAYIALII